MNKTIVLFQQDLRIGDNPALSAAARLGEVIPVYVLDGNNLGGASRWWLHHSLQSLKNSLQDKGVNLILRKGDTSRVICQLINESGAKAVYWNRCYEPKAIANGKALKKTLEADNVEAVSFKAGLLFEPWEILNKQGDHFKVFTPFWKNCLSNGSQIEDSLPIAELQPSSLNLESDNLESWKLLPTSPDWSLGLQKKWTPGENAAHERLHDFLDNNLTKYPEQRNIPASGNTSYLSPHLHFGEISPRQIWNAARYHEAREGCNFATEKFLSELGWREFSYYLLYHLPHLPEQPFNQKFTGFPWQENEPALRAWQKGKTGYPIIDAGMRELWHSGYMHNRVRMIVASFLTKDLLIHWQEGAAWFWDTLVDADLANNTASWQWVAGCGADASPYYRIFNPVLQGEKFDSDGDYIKKWLPELSRLPAKFIHKPWEADDRTLNYAGVTIGGNYPAPIINHDTARKLALELYKNCKKDVL